jgi:hypothetical protein
MVFKSNNNNNTKYSFQILKTTNPWPVNVLFSVFDMLCILIIYFYTGNCENFVFSLYAESSENQELPKSPQLNREVSAVTPNIDFSKTKKPQVSFLPIAGIFITAAHIPTLLVIYGVYPLGIYYIWGLSLSTFLALYGSGSALDGSLLPTANDVVQGYSTDKNPSIHNENDYNFANLISDQLKSNESVSPVRSTKIKSIIFQSTSGDGDDVKVQDQVIADVDDVKVQDPIIADVDDVKVQDPIIADVDDVKVQDPIIADVDDVKVQDPIIADVDDVKVQDQLIAVMAKYEPFKNAALENDPEITSQERAARFVVWKVALDKEKDAFLDKEIENLTEKEAKARFDALSKAEHVQMGWVKIYSQQDPNLLPAVKTALVQTLEYPDKEVNGHIAEIQAIPDEVTPATIDVAIAIYDEDVHKDDANYETDENDEDYEDNDS